MSHPKCVAAVEQHNLSSTIGRLVMSLNYVLPLKATFFCCCCVAHSLASGSAKLSAEINIENALRCCRQLQGIDSLKLPCLSRDCKQKKREENNKSLLTQISGGDTPLNDRSPKGRQFLTLHKMLLLCRKKQSATAGRISDDGISHFTLILHVLNVLEREKSC